MWTYRVDYTRTNEFGQGGEGEANEAERTPPQPPQIPAAITDRSATEGAGVVTPEDQALKTAPVPDTIVTATVETTAAAAAGSAASLAGDTSTGAASKEYEPPVDESGLD